MAPVEEANVVAKVERVDECPVQPKPLFVEVGQRWSKDGDPMIYRVDEVLAGRGAATATFVGGKTVGTTALLSDEAWRYRGMWSPPEIDCTKATAEPHACPPDESGTGGNIRFMETCLRCGEKYELGPHGKHGHRCKGRPLGPPDVKSIHDENIVHFSFDGLFEKDTDGHRAPEPQPDKDVGPRPKPMAVSQGQVWMCPDSIRRVVIRRQGKVVELSSGDASPPTRTWITTEEEMVEGDSWSFIRFGDEPDHVYAASEPNKYSLLSAPTEATTGVTIVCPELRKLREQVEYQRRMRDAHISQHHANQALADESIAALHKRIEELQDQRDAVIAKRKEEYDASQQALQAAHARNKDLQQLIERTIKERDEARLCIQELQSKKQTPRCGETPDGLSINGLRCGLNKGHLGNHVEERGRVAWSVVPHGGRMPPTKPMGSFVVAPPGHTTASGSLLCEACDHFHDSHGNHCDLHPVSDGWPPRNGHCDWWTKRREQGGK